MNTDVSHVLNIIVFSLVVLVGLISAAWAEEVTLSATFQEPSGQTGAIEVTVTLAEPAAPPVIETPETFAAPEPSTLALLGFGALGLVVLKKKWHTQ